MKTYYLSFQTIVSVSTPGMKHFHSLKKTQRQKHNSSTGQNLLFELRKFCSHTYSRVSSFFLLSSVHIHMFFDSAKEIILTHHRTNIMRSQVRDKIITFMSLKAENKRN